MEDVILGEGGVDVDWVNTYRGYTQIGALDVPGGRNCFLAFWCSVWERAVYYATRTWREALDVVKCGGKQMKCELIGPKSSTSGILEYW